MKGFTLIEVLISALILSLIISGIFAILKVADMSWNRDSGILELQQQARGAMDGMVRETRQSKPDNITVSDGGARVDFFIPNISNVISYYLSDSQIIREHPVGTTKVLANEITNLNFCCVGGADCTDCSSANILQIQLTAGKAIRGVPLSFSITEQVRLRNE